MLGSYTNIAVKGIVSAVPLHKEDNSEYIDILGEKRVKKQTRMTGVKQRHIGEPDQMTADLCIEASKNLLSQLEWNPQDVKVMVFVTQSASVVIPSTSFIIQKYLGLSKDCMVFDVNLGCSGYVSGLHIVASLLQSYGEGAKGLLLAGDIQRNPYLAQAETPDELADEMLFGSCGTATAIQVSGGDSNYYFDEYSDGDRYQVISRYHGGKNRMDGESVFEFAINEVTEISRDFLHKVYEFGKEEVDFYVFHQAQKFMLKNVASIIKIDKEKMLYSLEEYGNTSSASIPLTLCAEKDKLFSKNVANIFLCGFGVGLSCAVAYLTIQDSIVLDLIETDKKYAI